LSYSPAPGRLPGSYGVPAFFVLSPGPNGQARRKGSDVEGCCSRKFATASNALATAKMVHMGDALAFLYG
jgi:hypothetical protein